MLGNYKQKIKLLNELKLSNEEFDFLYMIQMYHNDRTIGDTEFIKEFELYYEINKSKFKYDVLLKIAEEKGYILNLNQGEDLKLELIKIDKRFKDVFIMDIDLMWKQVIEMYPKQMIISDRPATLIAISNPDIKQFYFRNVTGGGDKRLHEQFISLVEYYYGGSNLLVTHKSTAMKLEKFIYSWEGLKASILAEMSTKDPNQLSFSYSY